MQKIKGVDPKEHQDMFQAFMKATVYTSIAVAATLAALWVFLID